LNSKKFRAGTVRMPVFHEEQNCEEVDLPLRHSTHSK
jgi:hypothetical protein